MSAWGRIIPAPIAGSCRKTSFRRSISRRITSISPTAWRRIRTRNATITTRRLPQRDRSICSCSDLGANGHIGFNEPAAHFTTNSYCVKLPEQTLHDNRRFFDKNAVMPTHALTMGIASIMQAQHIVLVATGFRKGRGAPHDRRPCRSHGARFDSANATAITIPARRGRGFAAEEIGEKKHDPFISPARATAGMLRSGLRSVWAMKHIASMTKSGRRTRAR